MKEQLAITRVNRKLMEKILDGHTLEQLNKVPDGFRNNLIWNIAHVVITQQLLVYKLSGLPMKVSEALVEKYKKGTQTQGDVTQGDVAEIKASLFSTLDMLEKDIEDKIFTSYQEYPTSTGFVLTSLSDAIAFNNFHEGIHLGYILALKKAL
ncbi:DinB family protein [Aquimarina rhabdastrellae]